jgi:hypothetical protein
VVHGHEVLRAVFGVDVHPTKRAQRVARQARDLNRVGGTASAPGVQVAEIHQRRRDTMGRLLRVGAAGYGASRLGGGCITTVLIFILLYWLLGYVF